MIGGSAGAPLQCHSRCLRSQFKTLAGESLIRPLVLEENDLAERLATGLEANRNLGHLRGPAELVLFEDPSGAMGSPDAESALADRREYHAAIVVRKEPVGLG